MLGLLAYVFALVAAWRAIASTRLNRDAPRPAGSVTERAAKASVDMAHHQLQAELDGADSNDIKALGFLAVDLAAAALVVSVRKDLNRFWFCTVVGLGISATLLLVALWRRTFETGPVPEEFYEEAVSVADPEQVELLALEGLAAAWAHNRRVRRRKARWYEASLAWLTATAAGSLIYLLVVH